MQETGAVQGVHGFEEVAGLGGVGDGIRYGDSGLQAEGTHRLKDAVPNVGVGQGYAMPLRGAGGIEGEGDGTRRGGLTREAVPDDTESDGNANPETEENGASLSARIAWHRSRNLEGV